MPTYDYVCHGCGGSFEIFHSMSEDARTVCETCGGGLERLVGGGTGLIFKGSGFYINDYASSGKPTKLETPATTPTPPAPAEKPTATPTT